MAGTSDGGPSDYEVLRDTGKEADAGAGNNVSNGFGAIGAALAGNGGSNTAAGENAFANGARIGAQTIDALAQAKDRITKNQQAEMAGQQFENPQFQAQLKISPEEASYYATQARAGVPPQDIFASIKQGQSIKNRALISDPTADPNARRAALMAENPASADIHAAGDNGSYVDPMLAHYGTDATGATTATASPVSVSPLQSQLTQSTTGKNQAEGDAATTNAAANTTRANTAATTAQNGGKAPAGYQWASKDGQPVLDDNGQRTLTPITGGGKDPNAPKPESAVSARYHDVVNQAGAGVNSDVGNIVHMGSSTTSGANVPGQHGALGTAVENIGKKLSTTDQNQYSSSVTNIGRYLSQIENVGRMPPGTMTASLDSAVKNGIGDSEGARIYHLALIRQVMENGKETMDASSASDAVKANFSKNVASVQKAVPFTPNDVIDWERSGKKGESINDFMKRTAPAEGAPPSGGWGQATPVTK